MSMLDTQVKALPPVIWRFYAAWWGFRKRYWMADALDAYHAEGLSHFTEADALSLWIHHCEDYPISEWVSAREAIRHDMDESFKTIW